MPSAVLLLIGYPELVIYAAFGAFTGMYGRDEPHQLRLVHQTQAALFLLTGVTIGVTLAAVHASPAVLVGVEATLAGAGSLVADRIRLKPGGPFFGIFALGACASVPPGVPWWCSVFVCLASAVLSVLIGFAGWSRTRQWVPGVKRANGPGGDRAALLHAVRYVLAVAVAGAAALLLGGGHAYWAMAAAAVPLAADGLRGRLRRGVHRVAGTLGGVAVTALILLAHPGVGVLGGAVIGLQFMTELFLARHYGIALLFFTPMILIMTLLAHPTSTASLLGDRTIQTVLGALVGMLVAICLREPTAN